MLATEQKRLINFLADNYTTFVVFYNIDKKVTLSKITADGKLLTLSLFTKMKIHGLDQKTKPCKMRGFVYNIN